jgi:hypothetical protein
MPDGSEASVLGEGKGREVYALAPPGVMTGTADIVVLCGTDDPWIALGDYKSHAPGQDHDATEQLHTLALMASRAYGVGRVQIRTGLMGDKEGRWTDIVTLDQDDLDAIAVERSEQLTRPIGTPVPGSWCRWCPHRADCSATREAVDALADTIPASALVRSQRLSLDIVDDAHLEWTVAMFKPIEERLLAIRTAAKRYADDRQALGIPVTFADGRQYTNEPHDMEEPALNRPGCIDVIRQYGAEAAVRPATSWEAIEKTIGTPRAEALRKTLHDSGLTYSRKQDNYRARQTPEMKAAKKSRKKRAA